VAGLCIVPLITPVAFRAAELYRGGRVLSELLMAPYLRRVVPHAEREKFLKYPTFPAAGQLVSTIGVFIDRWFH
jgi:hypothetical protein